MSEITISQLAIYPVKSFAQILLTSSQVQPFGLQHDRRWMVVDSNNQFVTQRQHARMCLIQPALHNGELHLSAPGMADLTLHPPSEITLRTVTVWRDRCEAIDYGEAAAQWISQFLSIECRLVYFPDDGVRRVDQNYANTGDSTAFSDGFPLLLISQASLDDLNQRLETPIDMRRFRPNLVVTGCEAFAEDNWHRLRIGGQTFRVVKPCSRCAIPSIDPDSGDKGPQPWRALSEYRRRDGKIYFGQNVIPDSEGELQIGMQVEIL